MMNTSYKSSYTHAMVNGKMVPPFFTQDCYDNALEKHPWKDGDIVISTYPKSGTTLMLNLVFNMIHGDIPKDELLAKVCPWHETQTYNELSSHVPKHRRVWKSHLDWDDTFKTNHNIKYIYVARNPMDVAVSLYHHSRAVVSMEYNGDWNDNFERFISGDIIYGHWHEHVLGWWNAYKKQEKDILFLFYEDFVLNPKKKIEKVAAFLDVRLSDEKIEKIMKVTSFSSMKANPQTNHTFGRKPDGEEFVRKGIIGDWKETFTESQISRYQKHYNDTIIRNSDIRFKFEDASN